MVSQFNVLLDGTYRGATPTSPLHPALPNKSETVSVSIFIIVIVTIYSIYIYIIYTSFLKNNISFTLTSYHIIYNVSYRLIIYTDYIRIPDTASIVGPVASFLFFQKGVVE